MTLLIPLALLVTVALHAIEPRWGVIEFDDLREGQLESAGAVVMTLLGGVLLGRGRRDRERRSTVLGAGFVTLGAAGLFAAIATPLVDALARSPLAAWIVVGGGLLGATVLAAAVLPNARWLPAVAAFGVTAVAVLGPPAPFERLPATAAEIAVGDAAPLVVATLLLTAIGCWLAAWRLSIDGDVLGRRLALGLGLAAVAYGNYALFPSQLTELLYVGDAFFVLAIAVLLWAAIREITSTEDALVQRAVTSERTRVADELRAGVAQELAFMASQSELFARDGAPRHSLDELAAAVERALDSSRGAISALAQPVDAPLAAVLATAARDAATRFGARVEIEADDLTVARDERDALARLTHDCVIEATRHRGARVIVVELRGGVLRIRDDGRPATPTLVREALREQAEALGATFTTGPDFVEIALSGRSARSARARDRA